MRDTARQLEQVRGRARLWLAVLHVLRFVAVWVPVLFVLALIDWALTLPGWLRLVIGLSVFGECVFWLGKRLVRALCFRPGLDELALRAERIYPHLSGMLASSVEFQAVGAATSGADHGPYHDALVSLSVGKARSLISGVRFSRLIDLTIVARWLALALLALGALGSVVIAAPEASRTAAARWLMPFGSVQWPRSVMIEDATTLGVWPIDAPVRLAADLTRGHKQGMRVRVHYRITDAAGQPGEWNEALMTRQSNADETDTATTFERLIDLPPAVVRSVNEVTSGEAEVSYYFQAGDGQTLARSLTLVARPAVTALRATIEPPVYAAGLVSTQSVSLHEQSGQTAGASALIGSRVRLDVALNKPISITHEAMASILPGLIDTLGADRVGLVPVSATDADSDRFAVEFILSDSFTTRIHVTDSHGLENLSQRRYRIEAVEDGPPSVAITQPAADEAVLASATVQVTAEAQDDIGLERLALLGSTTARGPGGERQETSLPTIAQQSGRQENLNTRATLDLATMQLQAGDTLVLRATAQDVYELDGRRHDPVESTPRTLRIIDEPTMIAQLRTELAGLRQQVVRLEQTQQRIQSEQPPSVTLPQQEQVTQRLDAQDAMLDRLDERMRRNRLEDAPMSEMIRQADALVDQARRQSSDAAQRLREADEQPDQTDELEQQAHREQEAVRQSLAELADLLDQGRDVLTLKLQLQQLKTQQASVATDTRELLPQTVGQDPQQLDEQQRKQLEDLQRRQEELAEQARALTRQMQLTADALSRQGERDQDKAAAEALAEAAAIGQRQGLEDAMNQSSESMQQNQLSQAGQQQGQALDTIERMLEEMGTQEQRRQAILRRRLQELAALLRKLIERQTHHAQTLEKSAEAAIAALEPDQVSIRRATMGAQHQAGSASETAQAQDMLADAVREQGAAVVSLRTGDRPPALTAERKSIDHMRAALDELEKITQDNAAAEARRQRAKLREAYLEHAQKQDKLRESVRVIADAGPIDRPRRAALVGLSAEQSQLQEAIAETGQEVGETLVFENLHEQIGTTSSRIVSALRRGVGDAPTRADQDTVATTLRVMAEALKEEPSDSPFADSGSGGGGGGAQGQNPAVPPLAELKLIRGLQHLVYEQTRLVESSLGGVPDEPIKQRMLELSTRQRELSGLGKRLIEQMDQQLPTVGPDPGPVPGPEPGTGEEP